MPRIYTTQRVADVISVHKVTLLRWLREGKIREPRRIRFDGPSYRVWSERDVERVKKYKAAHYRKGRGRKKKKA